MDEVDRPPGLFASWEWFPDAQPCLTPVGFGAGRDAGRQATLDRTACQRIVLSLRPRADHYPALEMVACVLVPVKDRRGRTRPGVDAIGVAATRGDVVVCRQLRRDGAFVSTDARASVGTDARGHVRGVDARRP